jgi:hypothetical protein
MGPRASSDQGTKRKKRGEGGNETESVWRDVEGDETYRIRGRSGNRYFGIPMGLLSAITS